MSALIGWLIGATLSVCFVIGICRLASIMGLMTSSQLDPTVTCAHTTSPRHMLLHMCRVLGAVKMSVGTTFQRWRNILEATGSCVRQVHAG